MKNNFTDHDKIKVTKVELGDFMKVAEIQSKDGFEHAYLLTEERFARLIQRGECFYIAFIEGKAAGIISIDMEIRVKLHFFSVIKDFWGKGIGTALLTKVLKEAKIEIVETHG